MSGPLGTRLAERLRQRRGEIERATLTRVHAISDPREVQDPGYVAGLEEAVSAGLDYGLTALEFPRGAELAPAPVQLLAQARYAARAGVPLDTVLRRYVAGYTVLGDFIVQAAGQDMAIPAPALRRALRGEAALFDRVIAAVFEEYRRETEGCRRSAEESRLAKVRLLLDGELTDGFELDYELADAWHVGAIAVGPGARSAMRQMSKALDRRLLAVRAAEGAIWGWFGGRSKLTSHEVLDLAESSWPAEGAVAIGEHGFGTEGWRLTHRQAKAAMPVALRNAQRTIAYADVALFAAALNDELLTRSLRETYLVPLEREWDGGATLIETLHAYLSTGRNASAVAASLGVSRKTVTRRLRTAESAIERPLDDCAAELDTALRLIHETSML